MSKIGSDTIWAKSRARAAPDAKFYFTRPVIRLIRTYRQHSAMSQIPGLTA
jgi:hypothetical protein